MFSSNFINNLDNLPGEIIDNQIIKRLDKRAFYQLRLIDKNSLKFVSKTLAGGFVKQITENKPSYLMRLLGSDHNGSIANVENKLFASTVFNNFFHGAIYWLHQTNNEVCRPLLMLPYYTVGFLVPPLIITAVLSAFMPVDDPDHSSAYVLFVLNFLGNLLFSQSIGNVLSSGNSTMIESIFNSGDFFKFNASFRDASRDSIIANLGNQNLYGVSLLTILELVPFTTIAALNLYGTFKKKKIIAGKDQLKEILENKPVLKNS